MKAVLLLGLLCLSSLSFAEKCQCRIWLLRSGYIGADIELSELRSKFKNLCENEKGKNLEGGIYYRVVTQGESPLKESIKMTDIGSRHENTASDYGDRQVQYEGCFSNEKAAYQACEDWIDNQTMCKQ